MVSTMKNVKLVDQSIYHLFLRFAIDFGENRSIVPTHYSLRYASGGNFCCPRNWLLQGSNNMEALKEVDFPQYQLHSNDNENDIANQAIISNKPLSLWTTVSEHINDESLDS